jgi:PAS domain S-box-containing protein
VRTIPEKQTEALADATFRQLLESAPDAVIIVDAAGQVVLANAQAERLFGYQHGDLEGRPVELLLPERLHGAHRRHRDDYLASPRTRPMGVGLELEGRRAGGSTFPVEISLSPLVVEGGTLVTAIVRDVSERRRAEEQLRRSETRLAEAQQIAHLGSWEWDIAADTVTWSDELSRIYGLATGEFDGTYQGFLQRVHPDDRAMVEQTIADAYAQRRAFDMLHRIVRPDGVTRVVHARGEVICDEAGEPVRMVGAGHDITEQQEADERAQTLIREQAARNEAEAGQRRLAFLADASAILTTSLDYETTLTSLSQLAVPFLADLCVIDMPDGDLIQPVVVTHVDPRLAELVREMRVRYPVTTDGPAPVAEVIRSGRSMLIPSVSDALQASIAQDDDHLQMLLRLRYRSAIVVPLAARGQTLGSIMFVSSNPERVYSASDMVLAEELARRAAVAVDNARLYGAEQRARRAAERTSERVARLQAVTAAFSRAVTITDVVDIVIDELTQTLGANTGAVMLLGDDGTALEVVGSVGFPPNVVERWRNIPLDLPIPTTEVVRSGTPIWLESLEERARRYPELARTPTRAEGASAAIPLLVHGRAIGMVGLSFAEPRPFDIAERNFILALVQQCAQAIERARLFEAERAARAAAEDATRTREVFLSVAAHELRTPLTSIKAAAHLLERRITADDTEGRMLRLAGQLRGEVDRLERLVTDLLDVSRIQQGRLELRPEPTDLAELARAVLARSEGAAERLSTHRLTLDAPAPVAGVWDPSRLDQVLTNLLSNAMKYSPEGGEIHVRVTREAGQAVIEITDQGIGISPEEQARLFQPFARGDAARMTIGGTGLGLFISQQITARHGGDITVESTPGAGSRFTVRLPVGTA